MKSIREMHVFFMYGKDFKFKNLVLIQIHPHKISRTSSGMLAMESTVERQVSKVIKVSSLPAL